MESRRTESHPRSEETGPLIRVMPDGPYRVTGAGLLRMRPAIDDEGDKVDWERGPEIEHGEIFDLCRCGTSNTKPFCDGSEEQAGFDGTETAERGPYASRAYETGDGPVVLADDPSICSIAAFCHARGTDAWTLAEQANDPSAREEMIRMVRRCPSGRLTYFVLPEARLVEEDLPQEIGVIDNGPYWVRGGIPIEAADGYRYEVRNRVALCRCGHSRNKPFCDGSHMRCRFRDPG